MQKLISGDGDVTKGFKFHIVMCGNTKNAAMPIQEHSFHMDPAENTGPVLMRERGWMSVKEMEEKQ